MNRSPRPARVASVLSPSLNRQLNSYALAAAAAGMGMLTAKPGEAKVIYVPTHVVLTSHESFNFDLNGDGHMDFLFRNVQRCDTDQCFYDLIVKSPKGNAIEGTFRYGSFPPFAAALPPSEKIPGRRFYNGAALMASFYIGGGGYSSGGKWANVKNRFLGLSFKIDGKVHYGWARLDVQVLTGPVRIIATLTGYAYETVPGKPIVAGQTMVQDVTSAHPDTRAESDQSGTPKSDYLPVVPGQSLGLLARGSAGVSLWRPQGVVVK